MVAHCQCPSAARLRPACVAPVAEAESARGLCSTFLLRKERREAHEKWIEAAVREALEREREAACHDGAVKNMLRLRAFRTRSKGQT
jgi:hypothetical protein